MSFEVEQLSFEPPVTLPLGDIAQATHKIRNAPLERLRVRPGTFLFLTELSEHEANGCQPQEC